MQLRRLALSMAVSIACCACASSAKAAGDALLDLLTENPEPADLVLATAAPVPLRQLDWDAFSQHWDIIDHAPFDEAGFNPVILPFRFETQTGEGSNEEAHAFAFLLSFALDWTPGTYCARHAYFIFKRSGAELIRAGRTLDPELMRPIAKRWNATHVIGGELEQHENGYSVSLRLFDQLGEEIEVSALAEPRDFSTLVGDATCAVMSAVGHEPSPALQKHLQKRRCEHHSSLTELGKAAFEEERTGGEFKQYREIVNRDPTFSEVRYWIANQGQWASGNQDFYREQVGLALNDYVFHAALRSFSARKCPRPDLVKKFPQWLDQATALVGDHDPTILSLKLKQAWSNRFCETWLAEAALQAAAENPNHNDLLSSLMRCTRPVPEHWRLSDGDLTVALGLMRLGSRHMWASASYRLDVLDDTAYALGSLGHHNNAIVMLISTLNEAKRRAIDINYYHYEKDLGTFARQAGHHVLGLRALLSALEHRKEPSGSTVLSAIVCAVRAGQRQIALELIDRYQAELEDSERWEVAQFYRSHIQGVDIPMDQLRELLRSTVATKYVEALVCAAEIDLKAESPLLEGLVRNCLHLWPLRRELWILFDAYERRDPKGRSAAFYWFIESAFPDDPWAAEAARNYFSHCPRRNGWSEKQAVTEILEHEPRRWPTTYPTDGLRYNRTKAPISPFSVAAVVARHVEEEEYATARELLMRLLQYARVQAKRPAYGIYGSPMRVFGNHVYHEVDRVEGGGNSWLQQKTKVKPGSTTE